MKNGGEPDRVARAHEENLVTRCRGGDERAFGELYERYVGKLHGHARLLLGPSSSEVEDVVQKAFMEAFRNIHRFEGRSRLSTWLHGILVRVALNTIRSRKRRRAAMDRFEGNVPQRRSTSPVEATVSTQKRLEQLEACLATLPAAKRVPFVLYYIGQLELREVAEQMGLSTNATWARIERARRQVMKAMEKAALVERRRARP